VATGAKVRVVKKAVRKVTKASAPKIDDTTTRKAKAEVKKAVVKKAPAKKAKTKASKPAAKKAKATK
jgi:hypothetical protein